MIKKWGSGGPSSPLPAPALPESVNNRRRGINRDLFKKETFVRNRVVVMANWLAVMVAFIVLMTGCGPGAAPSPRTEPVSEPTTIKEPAIEDLRKPVSVDPEMFKAVDVLQKFGKTAKKHMTYEKYVSSVGAASGGAIDPDWFYDSYNLNMNENNYWAVFTFGTAVAAKEKDPRIRDLLVNLPETSIIVRLKAPDGRKYILSDANADGILDFAKDEARKDAALDIKLLDAMQEKYAWLLGIVKKYYKQK